MIQGAEDITLAEERAMTMMVITTTAEENVRGTELGTCDVPVTVTAPGT